MSSKNLEKKEKMLHSKGLEENLQWEKRFNVRFWMSMTRTHFAVNSKIP